MSYFSQDVALDELREKLDATIDARDFRRFVRSAKLRERALREPARKPSRGWSA